MVVRIIHRHNNLSLRGEAKMGIDSIVLPNRYEVETMSLAELREWRDKLEPYYKERYIWFKRIAENVENGRDKWFLVPLNAFD